MEPDFIVSLICLFLMPALYVIAGMRKLSILTEPKKYMIVFAICIVLAVIGLLTIPHVNGPNFYLFLISPLYSFLIFRLLSIWFKNQFGRDAIPTGKGLCADPELKKAMPGRDELFNFGFFFLSIAGSVLMFGIFVKAPL